MQATYVYNGFDLRDYYHHIVFLFVALIDPSAQAGRHTESIPKPRKTGRKPDKTSVSPIFSTLKQPGFACARRVVGACHRMVYHRLALTRWKSDFEKTF